MAGIVWATVLDNGQVELDGIDYDGILPEVVILEPGSDGYGVMVLKVPTRRKYTGPNQGLVTLNAKFMVLEVIESEKLSRLKCRVLTVFDVREKRKELNYLIEKLEGVKEQKVKRLVRSTPP